MLKKLPDIMVVILNTRFTEDKSLYNGLSSCMLVSSIVIEIKILLIDEILDHFMHCSVFHKLYLPYQVSVWLTTEITCSCLLAVQLSTSKNGSISIPVPLRVPVMAARSASAPEPTKLVPGERGVLDLDNASGCNNQAVSFLALCRPF
jgi:hypothetical protein